MTGRSKLSLKKNRAKALVAKEPPRPARKVLLRQLDTVPVNQSAWVQGIVIRVGDDGMVLIDDGSGVAVIDRAQLRDTQVEKGSYVMGVGRVTRNGKAGMWVLRASLFRDLSKNGFWLECLWNVEVVDAHLLQGERRQVTGPSMAD